ncbi:MAG: SPFH domain-containing protein [Spirochaetales bacterium]
MGFFAKLKKLFSNALECPDKFAEEFLYIVPLKKGRINLGSTLLVRKDFVALIIVKERVADVFSEGKHKLTLATMPKTAQIARLNKTSKKDKKIKDKFKAEICFVNLSSFENTFSGIEPFVIKDNELGRIKVRANGKYNYAVENAKTFLNVCLLEWAYIKPDTIKKQISFWVSSEAIKNLKVLNLPILEFAKNNKYISEQISPNITKKFASYGLEINNVYLTETFVPSKISDVLEAREQKDSKSLLENDVKLGTAYIKEHREQEQQEESFVDVEVENEKAQEFENENEFSFEPSSAKYNIPQKSEYEPLESAKTVTHVETLNTNLNSEAKRCANCGAILKKDATICYNCSAKQHAKKICGNCGAEVDAREFVCPNCRSIIID